MVYLVLHNLRSVHNVGSIFRTADAAGVSKIFLTGYTPAPRDRFGRPRKDLIKVSLGAEKSVLWESCRNILTLLKEVKAEGFRIVAVEQHPGAKDYRKIKLKSKTVFVFGNEVSGIPERILKSCHEIAEIPMRGKKESLNVSVAAGIMLFSFLK